LTSYSLDEYRRMLKEIKAQIINSQYKAITAVNRELILLYWNIGKVILDNQKKEGWGGKFIDNLSRDLMAEFPDLKGFSVRNLKYMRKFAEEYKELEFVQQVAAQIPWWHNVILMDKIKDNVKREWYIQKIMENGWSRNVLVHQIEIRLYERQHLSEKIANYTNILPLPQSELATETLKDPYIFDFIAFRENINEKDIEKQLVQKITKFLLELGAGFAFIGNQYHLNIANEDYYLDLLFYHIKLRCYVVIELKTGKFKPEYAGKLNFYLAAVDELLKSEHDNASIGIILCKEKNKLIAEYSLKDMTKPIGISEYRLLQEIPSDLQGTLPSIAQLEEELAEKLGEE
jgi:predicted nuclease of restriction endonuclease-like (RecB) superfamily